MEYVFVVLIVLVVVARSLRFVSKSVQKTMGRNRCQFCGVRLKTAPSRIGYASTCKKCGRTQPWAAPEVAGPAPMAAPIGLGPSRGVWVPDPLCRHEQRYWDGGHWTEMVKDDGYVTSDALGHPR